MISFKRNQRSPSPEYAPSLLDPHVDYLLGRIGEGCENAMALWRELRERGYPGTSRQVHRFVAERRSKPTRSGRKPRGEAMPAPGTPAVEPSLPSARQLAWLLVQTTSALDAAAAVVVARVEQDATASVVADLARRFTALVRASGVGRTAAPGRDAAADFDAWITTAKACSAVPLRRGTRDCRLRFPARRDGGQSAGGLARGCPDQAAASRSAAAAGTGFQFHGSRSARRWAGWDAIRPSTSASQA